MLTKKAISRGKFIRVDESPWNAYNVHGQEQTRFTGAERLSAYSGIYRKPP